MQVGHCTLRRAVEHIVRVCSTACRRQINKGLVGDMCAFVHVAPTG